MPQDVRLAEVERGERPVGLVQVLDGRGHVAEEEVGDAELEMELLLLRPGGDGQALVEDVDALLEVSDLWPALGQPLAELGDHPALEVLALDQQRAQIDQRFRHGVTPLAVRPGLAARRQSAREPAGNVRAEEWNYSE